MDALDGREAASAPGLGIDLQFVGGVAVQDIFLKLWDRPEFGLWREIVEDWDERS
ncbi:MAG: hypothetical protein ACLSDQ_09085 [Adlercreutzia equolifaciens]